MRVGIFGGAFNPPHIGHLVCAQQAVEQLELDSLLVMPMGEAPHREIHGDPGAEARAEMCEVAVADDERLEVSRLEVEREGPSYTVDTLRALAQRAPEEERVLILGGDQVAALGSWREPEQVLRLAAVAAVERSGYRRDTIGLELASLEGARDIRFFEMPRIDVSSTLIRDRVAAGRPIRYLVPDRVASYIAERGLYGASAPVNAD